MYLNCVLQHCHVIRIGVFDDVQRIFFFHVFDPVCGLPLRVNHKRPPSSVDHNYSVVHRHWVFRQPRNLPITNLQCKQMIFFFQKKKNLLKSKSCARTCTGSPRVLVSVKSSEHCIRFFLHACIQSWMMSFLYSVVKAP